MAGAAFGAASETEERAGQEAEHGSKANAQRKRTTWSGDGQLFLIDYWPLLGGYWGLAIREMSHRLDTSGRLIKHRAGKDWAAFN